MRRDDPAIWPMYETFYIQSMLFNVESALDSIDVIADVVETIAGKTHSEISEIVDNRRFLDQLQNIVVQAGVISRYLWPSKNAGRTGLARGKHIREALRISDENPLRMRSSRNAVEHFDERLDDYFKKNIVGVLLPEYVGRRLQDEDVPVHLFRAFYVDDGTFLLLGEEFAVQPIVDAIQDVHETLVQLDRGGGRLVKPADDA